MERVTPASSPFKVDVRFDLGAKGALPALTSHLNQAAADSSPHSITTYAAKGRDRDAGYHDSDLADESDDERVFGVVSSALVSSRGDSQDSDTPPFARRWKDTQQQQEQEQTQMTPILHDTTPEPGTPQLTPRTKETQQAQRSNSPQPQLDDKSDTASPTRAKSSAPEPVAEEEEPEPVEAVEEEMMEVEEEEEDSRSPPPRKKPPRGSSKASHEAADSEGALHRGRGRSVEKVTNWRDGVDLVDAVAPPSYAVLAAVTRAREQAADPPAMEDDASESLKEEADSGTVEEGVKDGMEGVEVADEEPADEEAVVAVAEAAEAVEEEEAAAGEQLEQEAVDDVGMMALDYGGGSPVEEEQVEVEEEEKEEEANEAQEEEAECEESAPAPVAPAVRPTRRRHTEPVIVKPTPVTPQPKRRGRPPGSKNKPKQTRHSSPESVPSSPASVASSSSSEVVQPKRRAEGRRHTFSPSLAKAKANVAPQPAPSSSGRPQRNRRSSDNWWDIGHALKLNEVLKRKVIKPVSEEDEEPAKPRKGRPRAKPKAREQESDDVENENGDDEFEDSPKATKRRGRPPSALKKTPGGATPNKRVRINAPPAKQQEPTPSPSPPRATSPKKKKVALPKPPRTAPTVLAKGSGPGWAEGGGWDNLREVGGIDEFSD